MLNAITISSVYVLDQDAALDFYVGKLGFEVKVDQQFGPMRFLTVALPSDPARAVLLELPAPPSVSAEIADQVGATAVRDKALSTIRATLTDWLTASPGEQDHLFYYDRNWGTLIGYGASYGSDVELNDHHFHYGYYIAAAATLAKFDPAWAATGRYGGMVDLLIRDANNYESQEQASQQILSS